jgi:hypothetical protein
MKHPAFAIAVAAVLACGYARASDAQPFDFYGRWHIDAIVGYGEVSVSDNELRRLIGQQVVIGRNGVKIGTDDCKADTMQTVSRETAPLLLREYKAGRKDAGVPARTLVLNAEPCGFVFRAGRTIVVYQDGAFYRASRMSTER